MAVETLISVEEYLNTSYSPDMEYVDGVLVERNVGEWDHCMVQSNIIFELRRKYPNIKVVPELRSKVTGTRYRLPDVCVTLRNPHTRVLMEAPYIAIEILSEAEAHSEMEVAAVRVELELGLGAASATAWGSDLSRDYVRINAHYRT